MHDPIAHVHHYNDRGRRTKKAERIRTHLASGNNPPILEIVIPDKLKTRYRAIYITFDELIKAADSLKTALGTEK